MQIKKIGPSGIATLIIDTIIALILFSASWRMVSLPFYRYAAAQWDMAEPVETVLVAVLVIASLGFAVFAAVRLMKIVQKHLLA